MMDRAAGRDLAHVLSPSPGPRRTRRRSSGFPCPKQMNGGWSALRCLTVPATGHPVALVVLVVAVPPDARLVAPLWCAVEPLVHAPEAVQPARIGGIAVVNDAVLER